LVCNCRAYQQSKEVAKSIKEIHATAGTWLLPYWLHAVLRCIIIRYGITHSADAANPAGSRRPLQRTTCCAQKIANVGTSASEISNKEQPVNEHEAIPG